MAGEGLRGKSGAEGSDHGGALRLLKLYPKIKVRHFDASFFFLP